MNPRSAVFAAAAVLSALLAGCAGGRSREVIIPLDDDVRMAEAHALARQAQNAGNSDRAIELYDASLKRSTKLGFVQNNLGLLLMERGQYMNAVQMFQEAADVMLYSPKPLYNIGLVYTRCGWDEKAMGYYEKALERSPDHHETLQAAVFAAKRLDLGDEASLARARRALLHEKDPQWRRLMQTEIFRIEAVLARARNASLMEIQTGLRPPESPAPAPGFAPEPDPVAPVPPGPLPENTPAPTPAPTGPGQPRPMQSPDMR